MLSRKKVSAMAIIITLVVAVSVVLTALLFRALLVKTSGIRTPNTARF